MEGSQDEEEEIQGTYCAIIPEQVQWDTSGVEERNKKIERSILSIQVEREREFGLNRGNFR